MKDSSLFIHHSAFIAHHFFLILSTHVNTFLRVCY
jgi:hypothetical protein